MLRVFLLQLPQEEPGPSCFHSSLANSRNRSFATEPFLQQRQEVPLHCPRSLQHLPSPVVFPAPWLSRSPCKPCKGSLLSLPSPCFSINPSSTVTNAQILERKKKKKLDFLGPAMPGVSQLWDGESTLPAGWFHYRGVFDPIINYTEYLLSK